MKAGRIIFRRASGFHSISPPGKGEYIQHTVRSAKVKQKVPEYENQKTAPDSFVRCGICFL